MRSHIFLRKSPEYIARAIKSNVSELECALTRLMAYASLTGAAVSLATVQQVLRNIIASQEKRVTIDLIEKRIADLLLLDHSVIWQRPPAAGGV